MIEAIKQASDNLHHSNLLGYVGTDSNGNKYLFEFNDFLVPVDTAKGILQDCIDYLKHADPQNVSLYNELLQKSRMQEKQVVKTKPVSISNIYLIHNKRNNYYKIGRSKNLQLREKTLQSEEPELEIIFSMPGTAALEKLLHKTFKNRHVRGEWFQLKDEDIIYIKSLATE